jgi:hypothetical protein
MFSICALTRNCFDMGYEQEQKTAKNKIAGIIIDVLSEGIIIFHLLLLSS